MPQYFTELTNATEVGKKSSVRALQAWQYLIGAAHNRQLVRYDRLAGVMGYSDNRALSPILAHVLYWCKGQGLPPLTAIVVNREGTPGGGFTEASGLELDRLREAVFECDWYAIVPPTIEEFQRAYAASKDGAA